MIPIKVTCVMQILQVTSAGRNQSAVLDGVYRLYIAAVDQFKREHYVARTTIANILA